MTRRLVASTVMTESRGGDLQITNKQGYVGRYQAGAGWLADAGYVDKEKLAEAMKRDGFDPAKVSGAEWKWAVKGGMTSFLKDESNWNNGLSLDKYKASADLQDNAFKINSDSAYRQATKAGILKPGDDEAKVAGFLKARHIAGYGGALAAITGGRVISDSNGTSNYDYLHDITRNRDGLNQYMHGGRVVGTPSNDVSGHHSPQRSEPMADGKLEPGERGDAVKHMQGQLAQLGLTGRDGKPLHPDGDFGPNTRYAVEQFQREHGLGVDGVVGRNTRAALDQAMAQHAPAQQAATPQSATAAPLLSDPSHPQHVLYSGSVRELEKLGERGGFANRQALEQAAGQMAFEAKVSGLDRIDHVLPSKDGRGLIAVQGELNDPAMHRVYVDREQAQVQPLQESTRQMAEEVQRQSQTQQGEAREPAAMTR
ncbi:hypothetical protein A6R71_01725 [Xanthomonas translucens pv. arrhenatheri]|nr:peptidoglycan-binding domain-containing protein [Xanthomonas translucens]OAX64736.1 hypothetical protein A6R71_01725 [Xanthomonas translucens pv. arrhenatheri]UKE79515.1 peptidoglycan-binding protein [Xanthomonas translucens pv. arrhenatheri]